MAQGLLRYQYEVDERDSGATALAGLPVALDLAVVSGLVAAIDERLGLRKRGWPDRVVVLSLILLNLAGGDGVEDVGGLAGDAGLHRLLRHAFLHGLPRAERKRLRRQMRRSGENAVPSPDSVGRYLKRFHDPDQGALREPGVAFVPQPNEALRALYEVNTELLRCAQQRQPLEHATLDMDATLVETHKRDAFFCYKKFRAYQPLQTYWAEREMLVHSEFRDGNVPAGYQQLRVLQEALEMLPAGIASASLRSDSAGYQVELLRYCAEGRNERFGVVDFAVSADVTTALRAAVDELREEDWQPLYRDIGEGHRLETGQEFAELVYVPNWAGHSKSGPEYRFLAIREPIQGDLPGLESHAQKELPFQTVTAPTGQRHKLFALVTNRPATEIGGGELIWWHRQRCGKSEQAHAIMKNDLAGGRLPSELFGANAAWWGIMVLAFNLLALLRRLALPEEMASCRLKALRFRLFAIAGRVVKHSRQLRIRVFAGNRAAALLAAVRERLAELAQPPPEPSRS